MKIQTFDIDVLLITFLMIVLGIPLFQYLTRLLQDNQKSAKDLPQEVRRASLAELFWGYGLIFFSLVGVIFVPDNICHISLYLFLFVFGVACICISVFLRRGNERARLLCLVLSVFRVFSIIGIPFSIMSIYWLYRPFESKRFFGVKGTEKAENRE